jgi:hypothetical protein
LVSALAKLTEDDLKNIKSLEKKFGVILVAYRQPEFADLTPAQLDEIKKLEKATHSILVAHKNR